MQIPKEVKSVIAKLQKSGYEAYAVGGCVRDFLIGVEPKDWDITTNAKPEEIRKVFPKSFYENKFLTVTVQTESKDQKSGEIEVTTYRFEANYTDKRHPDEVRYAKTLEEDLRRRDFTINAIALSLEKRLRHFSRDRGESGEVSGVIDPFLGQQDLKNKIIRTVGKPEERFGEDALRMMRAARFAVTLGEGWPASNAKPARMTRVSGSGGPARQPDGSHGGGRSFAGWQIEPETAEAIKKNAPWLQAISKERIRSELMKIIASDKAADGIELLRELGLLKYIIPELEEGYGISQNKHHIYGCYEHLLLSLKYAAQKGFNEHVKIASLLHDIAKPRVKRGEGPNATFYNHEIVGARMTAVILNRLKFPKQDIEKIVRLVRYHLFYYNVDEVTESSVRRLVRQVGPKNMEELLLVRMADRIGSGVPKAEPYKLRHLRYVIEKVSKDPISAKMLKINGDEIMRHLDIKPGPKIGHLLDILLGHVLIDPKKNVTKWLENEIDRLGKLEDKELMVLAQKARKEREDLEMKQDKMTKSKYWVT